MYSIFLEAEVYIAITFKFTFIFSSGLGLVEDMRVCVLCVKKKKSDLELQEMFLIHFTHMASLNSTNTGSFYLFHKIFRIGCLAENNKEPKDLYTGWLTSKIEKASSS